MGVKKDSTCKDVFDNEETAMHFLCECQAYSAYGFEYLGRHLLEPSFGYGPCVYFKFEDSTIDLWSRCWVLAESPYLNSFIQMCNFVSAKKV